MLGVGLMFYNVLCGAKITGIVMALLLRVTHFIFIVLHCELTYDFHPH